MGNLSIKTNLTKDQLFNMLRQEHVFAIASMDRRLVELNNQRRAIEKLKRKKEDALASDFESLA